MLLSERVLRVRLKAATRDAGPVGARSESFGEEVAMRSFVSSVKHARYALGSLTAVLFAASAGGSF
jgi:hypothetical protein